MVKKVLTTMSFIGGRLRLPGEEVDLDEATGAPLPEKTTPVGNMSLEELEAYAARLRGANKAPADSSNVADPTKTNTGVESVPLADITVRSTGTGAPQGAPPGAIEHEGRFVAPAPVDAAAAVETYSGEVGAGGGYTPPADKAELAQLDHDADGKAGGSLTKAEIMEQLDSRGVEYDSKAKRDDLAKLLNEPPKA